MLLDKMRAARITLLYSEMRGGKMRFAVPCAHYKRLLPLMRSSGCLCRVAERHGLVFLLRRDKYFFTRAVCAVFFCAAYLFFCSRVMTVRISGEGSVQPYSLEQTLSEYGIKFFARQSAIDEREIIERIMLRYDSLAWVTVNLHPAYAEVSLKPKTLPDNFAKEGGRLCVSSQDAVVTEIDLVAGVSIVNVGDPVTKDGLLAYASAVQNPNSWTSQVRGSVRGTYSTQLEFTLPAKTETVLFTGRRLERRWVSALGLKLPLSFGSIEYSQYEQSTRYKTLSLFGCELPARLYTCEYRETTFVLGTLTPGSARSAAEKICAQWEATLERGTDVLSRSISVQRGGESYIVLVSYRLEGEIAVFLTP